MNRIYCISDMHGNLEGLNPQDCEIVIIAGDFSKMIGFGKWHMKKQKDWIENKFFSWTNQYPNTHFVIIAGNHDMCLDKSKTFQYHDINWNINFPENVHYLENSGCEINGIKFYGSPNIPIISHSWAFESDHDRLNKEFSKIPENIDFLITHTPPRIRDSYLDVSIQTNNGPFGSGELSNSIFEKNPRYVICGHIHTGFHDGYRFNDTMIYNVSRLDERYEISYDPKIIEFEKE